MSVPESEFERKMQKIAAEIAPHLLPRRRDDTPLKEFKLAPEEQELVGMSGMAEVLAAHRVRSVRIGSHIGIDHMPDIGVYEQRCQNCGQINEPESAHQAAMLTAAGFGPVKEAGATALEEAADEMDAVIACGDIAEVAAPVEGSVGRPEAISARDSLYEEPSYWLRARAAAVLDQP